MFVPHYRREGTHPYRHHDDAVVTRQNMRIMPVAELDTRVCAVLEAPDGLFREVQRKQSPSSASVRSSFDSWSGATDYNMRQAHSW